MAGIHKGNECNGESDFERCNENLEIISTKVGELDEKHTQPDADINDDGGMADSIIESKLVLCGYHTYLRSRLSSHCDVKL